MTQKAQYVPTELGTQGVGHLLFQYALPAIIAMTASSMLNIVDRFFISTGVGTMAISGLATTFPFMNLAGAFGAMVGVGSAAVISIRLGQREYNTAQNVLGNTVTLNLVISILFTIVCWAFLDPLLRWFGASDNTLPYAREYMQIILLGNVISHSYLGLNSVIRSAGHPTYSMMCTIVAVTVNGVLDYLLVWVFHTGIQGAAIATVIAQAIGLAMEFAVLSRRNELLHLRRGIYRLKFSIVRQIITVGMSPFLMNCCACLVVLFINQGMRKYGDLEPVANGGDIAIGAYGIVNSIIFFFLMIVIGLNQGMQPIVGYNWGAHLNSRVWRCLRLTILGATVVTTAGFLIGELCPSLVTRIFTHDPQLIRIASRGFRIDVSIFPLVGAQMVVGNFFQSIGHAGKSIFISVTRQLLFLLPGLYILPLFFGLDGVWVAIPVADVVSCFIAGGMLWWLVRHVQSREA